jgi:hypothetical protein
MIQDDALGSPADLGQPGDVLALTGSLPGESFDGSFASLPENYPVLRHASTLVIIWWFACKPLRASPRKSDILAAFFGPWRPGRPMPFLVCDSDHIGRQHTFWRLRWGRICFGSTL